MSALLIRHQLERLTNYEKGVTMVVDGRRAPNILPYRLFVGRLYDDLQEILRVMENEEWHHSSSDTERWKCYNRALTWLDEVDRRIKRYAAATEKRVRATGAPKADNLD